MTESEKINRISIYQPNDNLMKMKNFTILSSKLFRNFSLACLLGLGIISGVNAAITTTASSPTANYTPGMNNVIVFNVSTTQSGAEYVDRFQFAFPAGVTIVSGLPASGGGNCATNAGVQAICSPSISWKTNA